MSKLVTVVALAALVAACGQKAPPVADVADPRNTAVESVTGAEIRAHMEQLASDDMQGREAGTEFYQRAADYVVSHYKAAGLQPLGDDGSLFSGHRVFRDAPDPGFRAFFVAERRYEHGADLSR